MSDSGNRPAVTIMLVAGIGTLVGIGAAKIYRMVRASKQMDEVVQNLDTVVNRAVDEATDFLRESSGLPPKYGQPKEPAARAGVTITAVRGLDGVFRQ